MKHLSLVTILAGMLVMTLYTPVTPATANGNAVHATAQQFEHGMMIWQSNTGLIRVLFDNGYATAYPVGTYASLPDNPYHNVPPGRVRPINGFGRVWGNNDHIRNALGWALGPEVGYNMTLYAIDTVQYLTLPLGETVEISPNNTWRYIERIPTPPPPPADQPGAPIISFAVSPDPAPQGSPLTATWQVQNVEMALIEVYARDDTNQPPIALLENLPLAGTRSIDLPADLSGSVTLRLWAANRYTTPTGVTMYEHVASDTLTVVIQPGTGNTTYTQAAYQRYENGFMIWRADTGAVIVFGGTDGGPLSVFPEYLYGPLPDNPFHDVPPGRTRPINGFGRVWGNYELVRRMLGWALGPEESYTLTITTGADGAAQAYTLPDGRDVQVTWRFWRF